jgi:hypothetical protein
VDSSIAAAIDNMTGSQGWRRVSNGIVSSIAQRFSGLSPDHVQAMGTGHAGCRVGGNLTQRKRLPNGHICHKTPQVPCYEKCREIAQRGEKFHVLGDIFESGLAFRILNTAISRCLYTDYIELSDRDITQR